MTDRNCRWPRSIALLWNAWLPGRGRQESLPSVRHCAVHGSGLWAQRPAQFTRIVYRGQLSTSTAGTA